MVNKWRDVTPPRPDPTIVLGPGQAVHEPDLRGGPSLADTKVVQISGVVKWFDVSKGFGFIVPDGAAPRARDVMLHVTCLRRDGYQAVLEGTRVVCEVTNGPCGLKAIKILSMDNSTAVHQDQLPPTKTLTVTPTSGLEPTVVKWFNRNRGFGFLTRADDTPDIFVHMETMRLCGITDLRPGQAVLARYGSGPKGLIAMEVRPLNWLESQQAAE